MGLARTLTMGDSGRRRRKPADPEITRLRRLTRQSDVDPAELLDAINVVRSRTTRLRFSEGAPLNEACSRYYQLTGEDIGCRVGSY